MHARFPIFLICLCYKLILANHTCYWPDGSIVPDSFDYTPCNLTASGVGSACCYSGDPCSLNGYCFGNAGYNYRGGCTDINWDADKCCPSCRSVATDTFSNIIPCPVNNGSYTHTFCCSENAGSQAAAAGCCDTAAFDLSKEGIFSDRRLECEANAVSIVSPSQFAKSSSTATASTSTKLSPISSSIPATTTSASALSAVATSLSEHSRPSKKIVDIGAAIGVPLGVLLISGLTLFLIHERRLRIKAQKTVVDTLAAYEKSRADTTAPGGYELKGYPRTRGLEHTQSQPRELYGGEIYEADVAN